MAKFAVIDNGTVINLIVADSQEIAEMCSPYMTCVEIEHNSSVTLGWKYDGSNFTTETEEE
jgi:hypothetical protein